MDFLNLKNKFDESIRRGEIVTVQNEIEKISPNTIPRELVSDFADIARRVRSEKWGLRLLRPIVRPETPVISATTEAELCSYAGLLIKVGALPEANSILLGLDQTKINNVQTFLSQIYIAQWNYKEAAACLKKVLSTNEIDPYQRCIAQVNLAGAFVFLEKYADLKKLLPQIFESCQKNGWDLLYGNALEISAQVAVIERDQSQATQLLQQAEQHSGQHSHYSIFIDKWRSLSELFQTKPDEPAGEAALLKIEALRRKAETINSWETVRDLDFHVALHLKHQNLLLNVYFGTPHVEYKKRIERICKNFGWKIPEFYFRKLSKAPATRILDLFSGKEEGATMTEPMKTGKMLHRLLNILAMDFYKPIGVGELFSTLFPDEFFNLESSVDRVSQAVKQLRKWFEVNNIPVDVQVENSRYALVATGPYAFKIYKKMQSAQDLLQLGFEQQLKTLIEKWPYQSFSATKAAEELELSASSIRTLLQKAVEEERIFKSGDGRSTLYRFQK